MIRLEIIANSTIRDDIREALQEAGFSSGFSWFSGVSGYGTSGPREGSDVWPDLNSCVILYLEEGDLEGAVSALGEVKKRFPNEGLRCWATAADRMV